MKHTIPMILCTLILVMGCTTAQVPNLTNRQSDVQLLHDTLISKHKQATANINRKEFDAQAQELMNKADSLSDIDFYFAVAQLVATIGDSHTMVGMPQQTALLAHALPLQIAAGPDFWYVSVAQEDHKQILGNTVTAINGIPIQTCIDMLSTVVSHDNDVWRNLYISQVFNITDLLAYVGIAQDATSDVVVTVQGDTAQDIVLTPLPLIDYGNQQFAFLAQQQAPTGPSAKPYRAMMINDGKTLFIQYNQCISAEELPIDTFIDQLIGIMESEHPMQVMVDLRYNGGGNSALLQPLIDYLAKAQLPLVILIGQNTFSSALMNAIDLRKIPNSQLVGSPSGGNVNHFGEIKMFTLPNSGIMVQYSTKYFQQGPSSMNGPLQPDRLVTMSIQDIVNGYDRAVMDSLI